MGNITTVPLFNITLKVGKPQPLGQRLVVPVRGGIFEGERLKGTVEEGGSDWITIRPDGALKFDVRLVLRTDDNQLIGMTYNGYRHGTPEVIGRLTRGEPVDPSLYYFRTAPFFETASEKYDWLNRIVTIAVGDRKPDGPIYRVFEVL